MKINYIYLGTTIFLFLITLGKTMAQQQTMSLILNSEKAFDGYTLIAGRPHNEATYLIDNCGRVVHKWPILKYPAMAAQLLNDGSLLRITKSDTKTGLPGDGRLEKLDWEGNLIWEYTYCDSLSCFHHDFEVMPNGNILLLAYELKQKPKLIENGRNPRFSREQLWPEKIIEIKPIGKNRAQIIWEWHVWDHLIQDYDSSKRNFGKISEHPERIDINFPLENNLYYDSEDWLHANAVAYNEELDQILISIRSFSEIWIIDHSTTSSEAATHKGGKSKKGGNLLYRWGNPQAYKRGKSKHQKLFYQHDAHWIPKGKPGAGNIIIFNNGLERNSEDYSEVFEIKPPLSFEGKYTIDSVRPFEPIKETWKYPQQPNTSFFSHNTSSARRMPNGNTLIVEGAKGNIFEIDSNDSIVWKYISPIDNGVSIKQGSPIIDNAVFNTMKYPVNHPAFKNRKMIPTGYIELNPLNNPCIIYPEKDKKR